MLADTGIICVTIDDYEVPRLTILMEEIFGESNHLGTVPIRNNPSGRSTVRGFAVAHEYALFCENGQGKNFPVGTNEGATWALRFSG
ncbi:MAG: hypothetical protein IPG58_07960 [Acidobacteria bacterium]|nr:hypothetical protein [Acidobacteriota bacterium]